MNVPRGSGDRRIERLFTARGSKHPPRNRSFIRTFKLSVLHQFIRSIHKRAIGLTNVVGILPLRQFHQSHHRLPTISGFKILSVFILLFFPRSTVILLTMFVSSVYKHCKGLNRQSVQETGGYMVNGNASHVSSLFDSVKVDEIDAFFFWEAPWKKSARTL